MNIFNINLNLNVMHEYNIVIAPQIKVLRDKGVLSNVEELSTANSFRPGNLVMLYKCQEVDEEVKAAMEQITHLADAFWHPGCIHKFTHDAYVTNGNSVFAVLKCLRCGESFSKNLREI
ncbi:hypothetical protein [Aeromonas phage SW69-9]|nr:hypothetical protein [Aeromonas phage SW69-9]